LRYIFASFFVMAYFLSGCATVSERAELYGIKMKREFSAKDFAMKPTADESFDYSYRKSTMDNELYAYGHFETIEYLAGKISSIRVTIVNGSETPLAVERVFASFALVTKDGERYELESPAAFYPATRFILPGTQETFALSVAPYKLTKEDIRMVICSFGLGETKIILFPRPRALAHGTSVEAEESLVTSRPSSAVRSSPP